ncbi:MAG: hypothetical protein Q4A75_04980 [Peptostreptococcaceae bacterium]|nr:hypothetical protein [Peptostreptococcaceae bacterium]
MDSVLDEVFGKYYGPYGSVEVEPIRQNRLTKQAHKHRRKIWHLYIEN